MSLGGLSTAPVAKDGLIILDGEGCCHYRCVKPPGPHSGFGAECGAPHFAPLLLRARLGKTRLAVEYTWDRAA
jgi:hypothetical protein